jgi:hypothetical protein
MNTLQNSKRYEAPLARVIPVRMEQNICSRPLPGGIEDIGYDEDDDY